MADDDTIKAWMQHASNTALAYGQAFDMVGEGRRGKPAALVVPSAAVGTVKELAAGESHKALKEAGRAIPLIRTIRGR